jgi:hypothetical protein
MALAAAACAFFDVPWPTGPDAEHPRPEVGRVVHDQIRWILPDGRIAATATFAMGVRLAEVQ